MPVPRTQPKLDIDDLADIYVALQLHRAQQQTTQELERIHNLQQRIKRALFALARCED